jgi:hypothetical protein
MLNVLKTLNHDRRKNIICISQTTWHGEFTKSTVQLLSLLAENTIVFVEYPFTIKDVMSLLGKQKKHTNARFKNRIKNEITDTGC